MTIKHVKITFQNTDFQHYTAIQHYIAIHFILQSKLSTLRIKTTKSQSFQILIIVEHNIFFQLSQS